MLDFHEFLWQSEAVASAAAGAFVISVALVATKKHHGHLTLDSTIGVQKAHAEPTPRVGGLGIYLGLLMARALVRDSGVRDILEIILIAGMIPFACGLAEDVTKRVGVLPRLFATMAGGVAAWMLTGICLNRVDVYGVDSLIACAPVGVLFTAFAIGGVANAINIIDGFHGLAGGTTIIALLALGAISARVDDLQLSMSCLLVAAAMVGFWLVNYPWGKLFLGDGGAYFAGFALAWLAVLLPVRNPGVSVWAGLLICAYPVIEVLYSVLRRRRIRRSPSAPDSEHLHSLFKLKVIRPRLALRGVDQQARNAAVAPVFWGGTALSSSIAIAAFDRTSVLAIAMLGCVLAYHFVYRRLASVKVAEVLAGPKQTAVPAHVRGYPTHRNQHSRRGGFGRTPFLSSRTKGRTNAQRTK
jgi:UDP-N-acetylmuramyl pentapeptide phosphotransferase/UDP-N-acetylglucosamine-1-phosphate transferase